MSKNEAQETKSTVISIRLKPFESARFAEIEKAVQDRNPFVDRADIIRELLCLAPCRAITVAELNYFRTGEKAAKLRPTTLAVSKAKPASRTVASKSKKRM